MVVDYLGNDDFVIILALPHSAVGYWLWGRHDRLLLVYTFPSRPVICPFLCPASDQVTLSLLIPGPRKNSAVLVVPLQIN